MSDFIENFVSSAGNTIKSVASSATIIKDPDNQQFNAAQMTFGTAGEAGFISYNLPKMKFSFVVEFILSEQAKYFIQNQLSDTHTAFSVLNCSFFVKDAKLPSVSFNLDEINQYNKTRYQTGRIKYKPSTITFYDTVDSSAVLLMDAYKKFYYGDFFDKDGTSFFNDSYSSPTLFESASSNWGRSVINNGEQDNQYFFKAINIYEIDTEKYTVHNMYNVFVEDIETEMKSHESTGEPSLLSINCRYEGMGNNSSIGTSIGASTVEIGNLLTNTSLFGKQGFFKYYGEMDDKNVGKLTVGKVIRAGTSAYDIVTSVKDILNGDLNADTIRNIGSAVTKGANSVGLGSVVSQASSKLGLGNILGDF
ncbi:tail tube protein [Xanthomonas phage XaC1]|nr:tail tube protein [Xanthomonas phage XaC1]